MPPAPIANPEVRMTEIVLRATDIKKEFSSPSQICVLDGISLSIKRGTAVAIMGKSGEGKSTLLHILGTLEKPTAGELEICGTHVQPHLHDQLRNQHLGFVFQSYNLLEEYSVLDNVLMPARIGRKNVNKSSPAYAHALQLLEKVGLRSRAHF